MARIVFLFLITVLMTVSARAAAPVGGTIWIRASATGLFVSADQNRGSPDGSTVFPQQMQVDWVRVWRN